VSWRTQCRVAVAGVTRCLPLFRGLGRVVLWIDRGLTSTTDPTAYLATAEINRGCRLNLDLRGWEQKFAYYYGRWEGEYIAAVRRHYTAGVFYDVGASIGLYATTFGRIAKSRGSYLRAFEPMPPNLERLRSQLSLNDLTDREVRIEPVALGDGPGEVQVTLVDDGRPGNAKVVAAGGVKVPVTTLDTVWEQNGREPVGFLKIDTEGWDAKILAGARSMITTCRPNLLIEFNRERMHNLQIPLDPVWTWLVRELGYQPYRLDEQSREIPVTDPGDWENLLFVAATR
jgi:FkbM family methyltransferase